MGQEALTEKIIGCAYRVYNKMGFGGTVKNKRKNIGVLYNAGSRKMFGDEYE